MADKLRKSAAVAAISVSDAPERGGGLPILSVLEPEAVPVPHAFKLVQHDGRENRTWTVQRLQQPSGEELQFGDVSVVQLSDVADQLCAQDTGSIMRITSGGRVADPGGS